MSVEFRLFGYKLTPATIAGLIALVGPVLGALYAGFMMYQKVESIATLDLDAVQGDIASIQEKLEANNDYTRDIKNGLRDDIMRIEKVVDRSEDSVNALEDKVRSLIDNAEVRETPPRAWGRRCFCYVSGQACGNTPTGVGKTPIYC